MSLQLKKIWFFSIVCVSTYGLLVLISCTKKEPAPHSDGSNVAAVDVEAARGRAVYQVSCTACHNSDPKKPGALGPDVFGSSRILIEARVVRAQYPPNYKPKRTTKIMQPLPQLVHDVDALYKYLNQ